MEMVKAMVVPSKVIDIGRDKVDDDGAWRWD